ncbi:hypothetical protein [Nocardia farcinica]|uniref:hypothetical protein n=1 Tax=Nocardia farcinica TaxID=37329 RepID=UPI0024578FFC|nr:hypothetical protein [Nocardia farcinica]
MNGEPLARVIAASCSKFSRRISRLNAIAMINITNNLQALRLYREAFDALEEQIAAKADANETYRRSDDILALLEDDEVE